MKYEIVLKGGEFQVREYSNGYLGRAEDKYE